MGRRDSLPEDSATIRSWRPQTEPSELLDPPSDNFGYAEIPQDDLFVSKLDLPQVTVRATIMGLVIGSAVLISNFQFGLQTGWVSMMSLPSALLGFTLFKFLPFSATFTDVENVYIQSVAVAVGTGPLAYGLVGIVPAIEKFLTPEESGTGAKISLSLTQLMVWLTGLAFFGVFFAVTLRKQVIIREKLPFPSGAATATLISVLHGTELYDEKETLRKRKNVRFRENEAEQDESHNETFGGVICPLDSNGLKHWKVEQAYRQNIRSLAYTFAVSAGYTILAFFVPWLKTLPLFGDTLSRVYQWNVQLSPAYIGQGIIMGLPLVLYMMFGAILGWGVLAPMAKWKGWAPGPIDDWVTGGQGWILWLSLSVMIADSLVSFFVVTTRSVYRLWERSQKRSGRGNYRPLLEPSEALNGAKPAKTAQAGGPRNGSSTGSPDFGSRDSSDTVPPKDTFELADPRGLSDDFEAARKSPTADSDAASFIDVPNEHIIGTRTTVIGLAASSLLCVAAVRYVFGDLVPYYATVAAIFLALIFSVLGVRALGETDLNPVSGIGKLSQLIFAAIIPRNHPLKILINLIAGGIAEAGAQQAGDLMQDLKTGYLVGALPKAQFVAQIVGTIYSVFFSSVMYKVYNAVYEIPSKTFRVPTAVVWIDCLRLVTGEGLPPHAFEFCVLFAVVFGAISLLKNTMSKSSAYHKYLVYLPNGVAVGIGIYNTPNFSIARFLGGALAYFYIRHASKQNLDNKVRMVIVSSGLVLGEGILSGFTMLLTSMGVRHF